MKKKLCFLGERIEGIKQKKSMFILPKLSVMSLMAQPQRAALAVTIVRLFGAGPAMTSQTGASPAVTSQTKTNLDELPELFRSYMNRYVYKMKIRTFIMIRKI